MLSPTKGKGVEDRPVLHFEKIRPVTKSIASPTSAKKLRSPERYLNVYSSGDAAAGSVFDTLCG
jgi:hypothetical protein